MLHTALCLISHKMHPTRYRTVCNNGLNHKCRCTCSVYGTCSTSVHLMHGMNAVRHIDGSEIFVFAFCGIVKFTLNALFARVETKRVIVKKVL